jgi:hypothetical protein
MKAPSVTWQKGRGGQERLKAPKEQQYVAA